MKDDGVLSGWAMLRVLLRTQGLPIHLKLGQCPRCLHLVYFNGSWRDRWLSIGLLGFGGRGRHRSLVWVTIGSYAALCLAFVWIVRPSGLNR